jgi:hypothetical protein
MKHVSLQIRCIVKGFKLYSFQLQDLNGPALLFFVTNLIYHQRICCNGFRFFLWMISPYSQLLPLFTATTERNLILVMEIWDHNYLCILLPLYSRKMMIHIWKKKYVNHLYRQCRMKRNEILKLFNDVLKLYEDGWIHSHFLTLIST